VAVRPAPWTTDLALMMGTKNDHPRLFSYDPSHEMLENFMRPSRYPEGAISSSGRDRSIEGAPINAPRRSPHH
jgi:hypothetical protein